MLAVARSTAAQHVLLENGSHPAELRAARMAAPVVQSFVRPGSTRAASLLPPGPLRASSGSARGVAEGRGQRPRLLHIDDEVLHLAGDPGQPAGSSPRTRRLALTGGRPNDVNERNGVPSVDRPPPCSAGADDVPDSGSGVSVWRPTTAATQVVATPVPSSSR
jgi:hypothetical protein